MKTRQIVGLFAALAFVLAAGAAQARTWKVGTLPLTKNADFATIGQAVVAASNGDLIDIGPGLYVESVTVNKSLSFEGAGETDDVAIHGLNPTKQTIVKPSSPSRARSAQVWLALKGVSV